MSQLQQPALGRDRRPSLPVWLTVGMVALLLVLTGCDLRPIAGDAPLRYRDPVFTSVAKTSDLVYGHAIKRDTGLQVDLKFDLYKPSGDSATSRPLVIWIHGGSFVSGNRTSPEIVDQINYFTVRGYVNASISYRLSATGCTRVDVECLKAIVDATEDGQAAVRYFRANAASLGIDPDRIAVAGTSAGAITALRVGYRVPAAETSGTPGVSSEVRGAVALSGAVITDSEVGPGDAPALLYHGTADPLVPYAWAKSTADAANAAGVPAYLITWTGDGHVPYAAHRDQILAGNTNFLYHRLVDG